MYQLLKALLTGWLLLQVVGCNLLVDMKPPKRVEGITNPIKPLTSGELFSYSLQNLGEVEPGLLYRSQKPGSGLLKFLKERVRLGKVINLMGGSDPEEEKVLKELDVDYHFLPMSLVEPPPLEYLLTFIKLTHEAKAEGKSVLLHCRVGADRTGALIGMWRRIFQDFDDFDAIKRTSLLHRHLHTTVPMTYEAIERLRPEWFKPLVDDPTLFDDEEFMQNLKSKYYKNQPLLSGARTTTKGKLKAGSAKVDLAEGLSFPVQMATYGPWPGKAEEVRSPVYARSVVLESGSKKIAWVACDLLLIHQSLRSSVLNSLNEKNILIDDLMLSATHTHTSIGGFVDHGMSELYILGKYDEKIKNHLVTKIVSSIEKANQGLKDAKLGTGRAWGNGLNYNRRRGDTVDPEIGILKITTLDDKPLVTVINFAGHPILEPGDGKLSGDYPGRLNQMLDQKLGMGMFLNGSLGDLNACPEGEEGSWRVEGDAKKLADQLFSKIEKAYSFIETQEQITLGSMTAWISLPPLNLGFVPDFMFPLDHLLGSLVGWPERVPLQAIRIGDLAVLSTSTELGVRLGLLIKRDSPSDQTFVVSHANGYAGYAVLPQNYALKKLDPTSMVLVNGSTEGKRLVDDSRMMLYEFWPEKILSKRENREWVEEIIEEDSDFRKSVVRGQTQRLYRQGNGIFSRFSLEASQLYLKDLHGGNRLKGTLRESRLSLRFKTPKGINFSLSTGYWRSDWKTLSGEKRDHEGATDLEVSYDYNWRLYENEDHGIGLYLSPEIALIAPTGDSHRSAPFAYAPAAGVFQSRLGTSVDFVWNTYRTISLETRAVIPWEKNSGRRPGERWETSLRYSERHGFVTWYLDWVAQVRFKDSRRGGRNENDVPSLAHSIGFRPGLVFHFGNYVNAFAQFHIPLLRHGKGVSEGRGGWLGLSFTF